MMWLWTFFCVTLWGVLWFVCLPWWHRCLVYRLYCAFPKDRYFYANQTYARTYSVHFVRFLGAVYLILWVVFRGELPTLDNKDSLFMLLGALLVLISSVDFKLYLIPFRLLVGLWVVLFFCPFDTSFIWLDKVQALGILLICFSLCYRGVGRADFYFLFIVLWFLPLHTWLWMILIANFCGLAYGTMIRLKTSRTFFAFGPWLSLSTWLMLLVFS